MATDVDKLPPRVRSSDEPPTKTLRWTNKQRVLVLASRGITHRSRHLMINMRSLLPHSKPESKIERKRKGTSLLVINEICEMKNCNKCIYFEEKKRRDLYMWVSNVPHGPSVKFYVENVHTMGELKMTGNCLKGSRALLSFHTSFTEHPHYALLQELFVQVFGTPYHHPKSQPFIDHVFTFAVIDNRIWFRNYQIMEESGSLAEIGPRFVLNPIAIFDGSFGGAIIWQNNSYVTPSRYRSLIKKQAVSKYKDRIEAKVGYLNRKPATSYKFDNYDDVFETSQPENTVKSEMKMIKNKKKKRKTENVKTAVVQ